MLLSPGRRSPGRWRTAGRAAGLLPVLLVGCASWQPAMPVPAAMPPALAAVRQFEALPCDEQARASGAARLLVLQPLQGGQIRWLMLDALGAPLARQTVGPDSGWRNDGFLPPNPQARRLFAALAAVLAPEGQLAMVYPGMQVGSAAHGRAYRLAGRLLWQVEALAPGWRIMPAGERQGWCVRELPA